MALAGDREGMEGCRDLSCDIDNAEERALVWRVGDS